LLMVMIEKYQKLVEINRASIAVNSLEESGLIQHFGAIESALDYIMTDVKDPEQKLQGYDLILVNLSDEALPF